MIICLLFSDRRYCIKDLHSFVVKPEITFPKLCMYVCMYNQ